MNLQRLVKAIFTTRQITPVQEMQLKQAVFCQVLDDQDLKILARLQGAIAHGTVCYAHPCNWDDSIVMLKPKKHQAA